MQCNKCGNRFDSIREYNEHIVQDLCESNLTDYDDEADNRVVYTKSGDPIKASDDISEFLNQDDDDYVDSGW